MTRSSASTACARAVSASACAADCSSDFSLDFDVAFHAGRLDRGFAADFELAQLALADDARFVQSALRGDARPLDFLAGGDLGFLQRLQARHFELLDRAAAFEPGNFQRLLSGHVGPLHLLIGDDIGFLHATVGFGALDELGRDFDRAVLIGDLHHLAALGIEHVAGLRRRDALAFQRQFGSDARGLDRLAALELGVLDRFLAGDVARLGFLLGCDTLGCEPLVLHNAGLLDGFARGDLGGIDRAVAGDLQRAHLLVARYSFAGDLAILEMRTDSTSCRDVISADSSASLRAISSPRVSLLGFDPFRGDLLVESDARGFGRLPCGDLGLLDRS